MHSKHLWLSLLLLSCSLLISPLQAQPAAGNNQAITALQQELRQLQQQQQQLNGEQQSLQQQVETLQRQTADLEKQGSPELDALEKARSELASAQAAFKADSSEENKAVVANAEFKQALADRKYRKANETLFENNEKIRQFNQQLSDNSKQLNQLSQQISDKQNALTELSNQQLSQAQQQQQQQRTEISRLQQELTRLRTENQQLKTQLAEQAAAAKAAAASTVAVAPAAAAAKLPDSAASAVSATADSDDGNTMYRIADKTELQQREQALQTLLQQPDNSRSKLNKMLNIRPGSGEGRTQSVMLEPLGHQQFRGKDALSNGDFVFSVGVHRWRETISEPGPHEFILDLSDSKNPKLWYFSSALGS